MNPFTNYILRIRVQNKTTDFGDLVVGECFTIPGDAGFGEIWTGFPLFIKTDEESALPLQGVDSRNFEPTDRVLFCDFGDVQKPE